MQGKAMKVEKFAKELKEFLKSNGMGTEPTYYTMEDWQDRGEPYGNDAEGGTLTSEGELCNALTLVDTLPRALFLDRFTEWCNERGFFWEQGFHWTVHFYRN